jgi:exodeoxyribonuclease VIII
MAERYVVSPRFNRACNDETAIAKGYDGGKQAAAEWVASVGLREVVEPDMWHRAMSMCDAILRDPVASAYIKTGYSEHKIEWTDTLTGIECRGRVDHVNGCLADLKTTRSLVTFERDVARFGYHSQLAWYSDGLAAAGIPTQGPPCLIAVENEAPFDVLVLTFDEDDLAVGRRVYRNCLNRLAECRKSGTWPGVSGGVSRRIILPAWADPIMDEMEVVIDGATVVL